MKTSPPVSEIVRLLSPLIGIRARVEGRTLELVEVMADGPRVALLDTSSSPVIQATQYGDPLSRQAAIRTLPVISEIEDDVHPVLRVFLPGSVLGELRRMIGTVDDPST